MLDRAKGNKRNWYIFLKSRLLYVPVFTSHLSFALFILVQDSCVGRWLL